MSVGERVAWQAGRLIRDIGRFLLLLGVATWAAVTDRRLDDDDRATMQYVGWWVSAALTAAAVTWVNTATWQTAALTATAVCAVGYLTSRPRPPDPRDDVVARIEAAVIRRANVEPEDVPEGIVRNLEWNHPPDAATHGWSACTVHWTDRFADGKQTQLDALHEQLESNLGCKVTFTPHTHQNYARLERAVDTLPDVAPLEFHTDEDWWKIPVGTLPDGSPACWDLKAAPHCLIVAETGQGKTTVQRVQAAHVLSSGHPWRVYAANPKQVALTFLDGMPGVVEVASTPHRIQALIHERRQAMQQWYADDKAGLDPDPLWELIIVDELAEAQRVVPDPNQFGDDLRSIASMGREARMHLSVATQRPDVTKVFTGDTRYNLGCKISTGPQDQQGSIMTFGDAKVGQDVSVGGLASKQPGRALIRIDGEVVPVQLYYVADPVRLNRDIDPAQAEQERLDARQWFPEPAHGWDNRIRTGGRQ